MRRKLSTALALFALAGAPALADEAWVTGLGPVIYEDEIGEYAVFLHYDGAIAHRTYIRGLAGNFDNRGHFTGYWTELENSGSRTPTCDVAVADENGSITHHWGRVEIDFLQPGFPGEWNARIGNCYEAPTRSWNGRLDDSFDYSGFGPHEPDALKGH
tara:strand:+ start:76195 stop:76668 length:474 start_codon:yes stop_codon:yes gene_type:complete